MGCALAVVGEVRVWWISTGVGPYVRAVEDEPPRGGLPERGRAVDEECLLRGGLVLEAFRRLVEPRSSRKFFIADSRSFLEDRSSLSGRRCLEICFGSRSGLPSTKSPSASIGIARTTFPSLSDSDSG